MGKKALEPNARAVAYEGLDKALNQEQFLGEYFSDVRRENRLKQMDLALAEAIAYGVIKHQKLLDVIAKKLSNKKQHKLKRKEKLLLWIGIYQLSFLDKIPTYAAVNETVKLAKKLCHRTFVSYLNALLRKVSLQEKKNEVEAQDLSVQYSTSKEFIKELSKKYKEDHLEKILKASNQNKRFFFRLREGFSKEDLENNFANVLPILPPFYEIKNTKDIPLLSSLKSVYIQNMTPYFLFKYLADKKSFKKVLDLCAAPGGKAILASETFKDAKVTVNDISDKRLSLIRSNIKKYELDFEVCNYNAIAFNQKGYDLVILDVPCTNSGVLSKRPEASMRITSEMSKSSMIFNLSSLKKHASLFQIAGEIWYMTCSILPSE